MTRYKKKYLTLQEGVDEFKRLVDNWNSWEDFQRGINSPDYDGPGDRVFSWGGFYLHHGKEAMDLDPTVWPEIKKVCHDFFNRANAATKKQNLAFEEACKNLSPNALKIKEEMDSRGRRAPRPDDQELSNKLGISLEDVRIASEEFISLLKSIK
jgi:hypothetical protein